MTRHYMIPEAELRQVLEALLFFERAGLGTTGTVEAITSLRARLDAGAVEPVAWQWLNTAHFRKKLPKDAEQGAWNPLYAPQGEKK